MPRELGALLRLRPAFRRIVEGFGALPVGEYERAAVSSLPAAPVRTAFAALLRRDALPAGPVVATGMHTGLLAGASPLMSLLYAEAAAGPGGLTLSNSSITLNNAHGPELLCLPTGAGVLGFHLFPKRRRKQPLASLPGIDLAAVQDSVAREARRLLGSAADALLAQALQLVEAFWPREPADFLTEQIGAFNTAVVSALRGSEASPGLWVAQEAFIARYFAAPAPELSGPLSDLLFSPDGYAELARVLEGIAGFSNDPGSAKTAFFWQLSQGEHSRRAPTRVQGEVLVAGEQRYELSGASLAELLAQRRIVPSKVVKFLLVHFAWGFPVAGGHNQVEYLTELGDALAAAGLIHRQPDQLFRPTRAFPLPGLAALGSPFELLVDGDAAARTSAFIDGLARMTLTELLTAYAPHAVAAIAGGDGEAAPS